MKGSVVKVIIVMEKMLKGKEKSLEIGLMRKKEMWGKRVIGIGERKEMEVVEGGEKRKGKDWRLEIFKVEKWRKKLKKNVDKLIEKKKCEWKKNEEDKERDGWIEKLKESKIDDDWRGDKKEREKNIGKELKIREIEVKDVIIVKGKYKNGDEVNEKKEDRKRKNEERMEIGRLGKEIKGLIENIEGKKKKKERIERRRKYIEKRIEIGEKKIGREEKKIDGDKRKKEGEWIGRNVNGVWKKRKNEGGKDEDELGNNEDEGKEERDK